MANPKWKFEATDRKIRVVFNGETIAETTNAMLMIEHPGELHYYFPQDDVNQAYLEASDHSETSGYRGTSTFKSIRVRDKVAENAAWTYPEMNQNRPDLSDYIAFKWDAMDAWYEEAEEVFYHPRNPYHRVDALQSSRHVKVVVAGETIAETNRPVLVFETGLQTRYYLLPDDVNQDYLTATDTSTICPYKGTASYWTVKAGDKDFENIVWSYPDPIDQQPKIKDLMAFWTEKDKAIELYVDGELVG